jgi:hypothetical protein
MDTGVSTCLQIHTFSPYIMKGTSVWKELLSVKFVYRFSLTETKNWGGRNEIVEALNRPHR